MSIRFEASVVKGSEIVTNLQNLSQQIKPQIQEALSTVGGRILQDMRNFTPVRTGYLLSTENMEQVNTLSFVIYARAYYAPFVEWGTRRIAARLFMTRAFELHKDEVTDEVSNAMFNLARNLFG